MDGNVYRLFNAWYKLWNSIYVPQILSRKKWFSNSEEQIDLDDIVLFKLKETEFSTNWVLGKIESVRIGRDGVNRECIILYKSIGKTDEILTVERSTRDVVKLFNIEDTSLYKDIENVRKLTKSIFENNPGHGLDSALRPNLKKIWET